MTYTMRLRAVSRVLLLLLAAAVLAIMVQLAAPQKASAECRSEPFAGDVYHNGSSQSSILTISTGTTYNLPRGWASDAYIPSGNCRDVDYILITNGWNLQQYIDGFGWSHWRSSTGWHKISGGNFNMRAVRE